MRSTITLGPLEQEVMKCVWERNQCTARDITTCLATKRQIAYNTIQTIMTRLVEKGMLTRKLAGRTHVYTAKQKKRQTIKTAIKNKMDSFISQFGEEAVIAFVDGLDDISEETRQKLIKKLHKK